MATVSFRELISVCTSLGLRKRMTRICLIYEGYIKGRYCRIIMHIHSEGRDIPNGTFHRYVRDLGFNNENDFFQFLHKL